ncbi:MAG: glutathione S-transferase family protein [Xanthomonadales bacterium]|nr:glutathione S-transferase family protein [Xanthomonadales bacterium]
MNHTLIGMFDSPFVRRVAITMHIYEMPFEHRRWSVFGDFDRVSEFNPLGRVPILLLDDDEALIESSVILDYLDESAGPERALIPRSGPARRHALKRITVALGGCEKAVALFYETVKREERYTDPGWAARLQAQVASALDWVEGHLESPSDDPDQAAITSAVFWRFLAEYLPDAAEDRRYTGLSTLSRRCERHPAFRAIPFGEEATIDPAA